MARKKEPTEFDIRNTARRTRQVVRGTIDEYYGAVIAAVDIEYQRGLFEPDAALFNATPEQVRSDTYGPEDIADFAFPCHAHDCVSGLGRVSGHILNDAVDEMVRERVAVTAGRIFCRAWQDFRRVGAHECLTEFSYRIRITYANALESARSKSRDSAVIRRA
jgi:hypothetical protein